MKITAIETVQLPQHPHLLWLLVHTDQGITGLGETFPRPGASRRVLHDVVAEIVLGRDPRQIERIWWDVFQAIHYHGFAGAEMRALSALDIALWDILGQWVGQPIWTLLGGACRDRIPTYNTCVSYGPWRDHERSAEDPAGLAKSLLEDGIDAMKVWPFDDLSVPTLGQRIDAGRLERGVAVVRAIREAVGDRMDIAVEGHGCWNLPAAVQIARALEPYRPMWLEEMIRPDSPRALAELRRATRVPICGSERLFGRWQFLSLIEEGAVDIVMPDVVWTGGITEFRKIAVLASTRELPVAPHNCGGPVQTFANAHLAAHLPNLYRLEVVRAFHRGFFAEVVEPNIRVENGEVLLPAGPGLGTRLRPEVLGRPDVIRERTESKSGLSHWMAGDPWRDRLGDRF